jgi:hypothetical protein
MENRNHKFRHKQFAYIDRLLLKLATSAIVLLLMTQALLLNGETRKYLSLVDQLEGEQITSPAAMYAFDVSRSDSNRVWGTVNKAIAKSIRTLRSGKTITVRMITPPTSGDAFVTINGEIAGNFAKGKVELTIFDGDYMELDITAVEKPAQFIIDTHKNDMIYPADGILLEGKDNILVIGKAIFKQ